MFNPLKWGFVMVGSIALVAMLFSVNGSGFVVKGSSFRGFNLSQCRKDNSICLRVEAERADGSQFRQIFAFNKVKVIIKKINSEARVIESPSGYIDYDNNQLVLTDRLKNLERVFNLTTLGEKIYKVR